MKLGFVGAGNMATGHRTRARAAEGEPGRARGDAVRRRGAGARAAGGRGGRRGGARRPTARLADAADLVVLAVKPNVLDDVARDLVEAGTPVISILAGTSLERLAAALPGSSWCA